MDSVMSRGAIGLVFGALAAIARAQVPGTIVSGNSGESFGFALCAAGDVDHDGTPDWAAGAPITPGGQVSNIGRVRICSGRTGAVLRTYDGASPPQSFGRAIAGAGDVDADGYPDLVVGATASFAATSPPGFARIYSGRDGSVLHTFAGTSGMQGFGYTVAGVGDVNGDGHADVAVGAPGDATGGGYAGAAFVYSGLDGSLLFAFHGTFVNQFLGSALAGGRDLDHDGRADFVIGSSSAAGATGFVRAHSGASGTVLFTTIGPVPNQQFGSAIDLCGDVDQDGTEDLVVGSNYGSAAIVSGASGAIRFTFVGDQLGDSFGVAVCGPGDLDGDGWPDVVVGAPTADPLAYNSGWVRIFSGRDGSILATIGDSGATTPYLSNFGATLAAIGDVNGDGTPDFVAGAPGANLARVILGGCPPPEVYCSAKTNSLGCTPHVAFSGAPSLTAGGIVVSASNVLSHAPGMLFWGTIRATIPFGGGMLCASGSPIVRTPIQSAGGASAAVDCSGAYTFHFTSAYMSSKGLVPGSRVCAQFYSRDNGFAYPNSIGLTDAVEFLVCP